jgi:hypothetical protein
MKTRSVINFVSALACSLLLISGSSDITMAQSKYFTREGKIEFLSKAPLEDIHSVNKKVTAILDTETGQMEFSVLMKAFEFEKALMMEHFNENYVESDKFPKSVFKGKIDNVSEVKWKQDGTYPVKVSGSMTIHGVTKEVSYPGTIMIKNGKINGNAEIDITLKDYNISIPRVVKDNISETVKVTIEVALDPFK